MAANEIEACAKKLKISAVIKLKLTHSYFKSLWHLNKNRLQIKLAGAIGIVAKLCKL